MIRPTIPDVEQIAVSMGFDLGSDAGQIVDVVESLIEAADAVLNIVTGASPTRDSSSRRSTPQDDPLNAIVRWCNVEPTGEGPLSGRTVSVKDSIFVQGVPTTCGFSGLNGFASSRHSTVVERVLRAGGRIVATTNMDCFGFAAAGESSSYGPTLNPASPDHLAGGSSSGAGAALSYPSVDLSLGCDQGGSIRIPAAWCGVLGLKPTHGWTPYTGIAGIDQLIDHVGPLARSVKDVATLMDVLVGSDGLDPRQREAIPPASMRSRVANHQDRWGGLRIGLLEEAVGLSREQSSQGGLDVLDNTCHQLTALGATVTPVSIPEHLSMGAASLICNLEGIASLLRSGGQGYGQLGTYEVSFATALQSALRDHLDELSPQVKVAWLAGNLMSNIHGGAVYGAARNELTRQAADYAKVFADVDVLIMPTTAVATSRVDSTSSTAEFISHGWSMLGNTAPFNATGMPALSMPTGTDAGLPVGTMLVGPRGSDPLLLEVAGTYEATYGWKLGPLHSVDTPDWK